MAHTVIHHRRGVYENSHQESIQIIVRFVGDAEYQHRDSGSFSQWSDFFQLLCIHIWHEISRAFVKLRPGKF